jgi:hypothetical protein
MTRRRGKANECHLHSCWAFSFGLQTNTPQSRRTCTCRWNKEQRRMLIINTFASLARPRERSRWETKIDLDEKKKKKKWRERGKAAPKRVTTEWKWWWEPFDNSICKQRALCYAAVEAMMGREKPRMSEIATLINRLQSQSNREREAFFLLILGNFPCCRSLDSSRAHPINSINSFFIRARQGEMKERKTIEAKSNFPFDETWNFSETFPPTTKSEKRPREARRSIIFFIFVCSRWAEGGSFHV